MASGGCWTRGRLSQGQHLEPKHREDAGHQVQDEATQEGQADGQGQMRGGLLASHGRGCACPNLRGGRRCIACVQCPESSLGLACWTPNHLEWRGSGALGQHAFCGVRQGNVEAPAVGGGRDHLGGCWHDQALNAWEQEALQGLRGTQAPDHQMRAGDCVALACGIGAGQALLGCLECGPLARCKQRCSGALHGEANQERGLSGDTDVAACQPLRTRNQF